MVLRDLVIDVYIWTGFIIWEKRSKKKKICPSYCQIYLSNGSFVWNQSCLEVFPYLHLKQEIYSMLYRRGAV